MRSKVVILGGLVAASLFAAACGGPSYGGVYGSPSSTPTSAPPTRPVASPPGSSPAPVAAGPTIAVGNSRLGSILVDGEGRTLYLFLADKGSQSACNSSACVRYWPPVLTTAAPQAGPGVNPSLLGTTRRADNSIEVTYGGHPLYYFISDIKAGDVSGQGVNSFGAPWYAVSPSGMQVV